MFLQFFHPYGFILGLGIILGYSLSKKLVLKRKMDIVFFDKLVFWLVFGGLIGARLYHILDFRVYYLSHPMQAFAVWNGGLATYGAILGVGITCLFQLGVSGRMKRFFEWTDILVPGALMAQAIGRWGNYVNQEAFGPPTDFPWAVLIRQENRPLTFNGFSYFHPLFLYESLWNILGLFILLKSKKGSSTTGRATGFYLIWYGGGRFFYEFGRSDTATFMHFKTAQIISIITILLGVVVFVWTSRRGVGKIKDKS